MGVTKSLDTCRADLQVSTNEILEIGLSNETGEESKWLSRLRRDAHRLGSALRVPLSLDRSIMGYKITHFYSFIDLLPVRDARLHTFVVSIVYSQHIYSKEGRQILNVLPKIWFDFLTFYTFFFDFLTFCTKGTQKGDSNLKVTKSNNNNRTEQRQAQKSTKSKKTFCTKGNSFRFWACFGSVLLRAGVRACLATVL